MNTAGRDHLIELRREADGAAPRVVAFLHSSSGSASGFRRLVKHLRAPARYVAFQAVEPGADDRCSVPAIAADYWRDLEPVLREEPSAALVLVGWSFGGVLAVEMARLAEAEGRGAAHVVLLDAGTPDMLSRCRGERSPAGEIASLFGITDGLPVGTAALDDASLVAAVLDRLSGEGLGGLSASDLLPYLRTHRWHLNALSRPWSAPACAARVTLIRATDEDGWADTPADLGWSQALGQDVEVLGAPGTHHSLLSTEHAPSLAPLIDAIVRGAAARADEDGLPLSSAQARLWFLWQLEPDGAHYTTQLGWRIPGASAADVRKAWLRLCDRHPILRSSYRLTPSGQPQRFVDPAAHVPVELVRLAPLPGQPERAIGDLASEHFRRPFDLQHGSVRAVIAEDGADAVWLVVSCHHIAVDGWCLEVIERDLRGLLRDPSAELPALAADYQDFVAWEQTLRSGPYFGSDLSYWVDALKDIEVSPPAPDPFEDGEPGAASVRFRLSARTVSALESASMAAGVTMFAGLLTCLAVALQEWAEGTGVAVGVNLANRPRSDFEDVVGMFVDPVVLWLRPSPEGRFDHAVEHVWERLAGAFEHADVPYQDVVTAVDPVGRDPWSPLFWVVVNMDQLPDEVREPRWEPIPSVVPPDAKFPFAAILQQGAGDLGVEFLYPRDRYRPSTVDRVRRRFEQLVRSAGSDGFGAGLPPVAAQAPLSDRFARRFATLSRKPPVTG
ncbi:hypothetical protein GCM10023322_71460 [Rugosimonospora acidiphila]|uniref:Uncharacterized protein n=1 Tax=Rugosimonospora acidiphila TaxID=556531 RepID=A0ABP9SNF8_9ACTN